jgi:two-component system, LytTR family, response regulator
MDQSFNVLIVDDEKLSRDYVRDLVEEFAPSFSIREASSAKKAKPILQEGRIDILFLDINMRDTDGFGLLQSLDSRDFELVFVTAYAEHTIQAIREGASDYIMKPIGKAEFGRMLQRIVAKRSETLNQRILLKQSLRLKDEDYLNQTLSIHQHSGVKFVQLRDIIYLTASNSYTDIYLVDREPFTATKPIRRFEELLDQRWFFRIHKSFLINMLHFREYLSENGDQILMDNGAVLPISRHRLSEFLTRAAKNSNALKL